MQRLKRFASLEGGLPLVWIALFAVALVPLWSQRVLPMLEVPNDLAVARIWHSLHDPSYRLEHYALRLRPLPGTLVPALLSTLMYLFRVDLAHKLLLTAYLALFPLSVLLLARALHRSPWLALGAFPLAFNRDWMFGFTGLLLGGMLAFFGWTQLLKLLHTGARRHLAWVCVLSLLIYAAGVTPFVCFWVGSIALCLAQGRRWRATLDGLFALAPVTLLAGFEALDAYADQSVVRGNDWAATYRDFPSLVLDFPKRVLDVLPGPSDLMVAGVLAATVVVLMWWPGAPERDASPAERRELPMLIGALVACYALLPWDLTRPVSAPLLAPHVAPLLAALLLLLPTGALGGRVRLVFLPLLVAAVVMPLKLNRLYRDFGRRNASFLRLAHQLPRGARTLVLMRGVRSSDSRDLSSDPSTSGALYWYWPDWPLAFSGGYSPYLDEPSSPIEFVDRLKAPATLAGETWNLRQMPDFDFYLVRAAPSLFEREPALKIVDQLAEWTLFHRQFSSSEEP